MSIRMQPEARNKDCAKWSPTKSVGCIPMEALAVPILRVQEGRLVGGRFVPNSRRRNFPLRFGAHQLPNKHWEIRDSFTGRVVQTVKTKSAALQAVTKWNARHGGLRDVIRNPANRARREWRVIGRNASPIHAGWLLKSEALKILHAARKAGDKFLYLRRGWSGR